MERGRVYVVGAGPGDPGLITRRGVECLRQADLVLVDYLVNPAVLDHAGSAAERVWLGHHGLGRAMPPEEVVTRMIEAAKRGRNVVRLKGGDPSVFAREGEELEALRTAGIPLEIVPGITSGQAAACCAGAADLDAAAALVRVGLNGGVDGAVPSRFRKRNRRHACLGCALVTGHQRTSKGHEELDYGRLASFPGVLLFYMGIRSALEWSDGLLAEGRPPGTPVSVVRRCTWPDERIIHSTLGEVAELVRSRSLRPPAIVVVGHVRPLEAVEPADPLDRVEGYDWLVLGGPHDVTRLLAHLSCTGSDVRRLAGVRLAALGQETGRRLVAARLRPDLLVEFQRDAPLPEPLVRACRGRAVLLAHSGDESRAVIAALASVAGRLNPLFPTPPHG